MKSIPLSSIHIRPDRQRKEFDEKSLNELVESIKAYGLLHPIVLREPAEDEPQDMVTLVSGERRVRAIQDIYTLGDILYCDGEVVPAFHVPYTNIGELSPLDREEAEFDENTKRRNLSWQEEAKAVRRLAAARAAAGKTQVLDPVIIRGVARTAIPAAADLPTGALGGHQEDTRRQVIVAAHLSDPEVAGAKSVDDAFKLLRRKEEASRRVQLAAEVGRTYTSAVHTLLNEDSLAWMAAAPAGQFDVICTDPPYGIGADEFGDSGGKAAGAHFYEDSYENWKKLMVAFAREGFRLTRAQAHLYAFCDVTRFEEFKAILAAAGWDCFRTPIIWHKPNGPRAPWPDGGPQRKWEMVLYARKGKKPVTKIYPDLVSYPTDENLGHPAQKPVALFSDLLRRSVSPGDSVLDPFAGTGTILPAAQELKVKATALELDAAAYGAAVKRLDRLKDTPELEGV